MSHQQIKFYFLKGETKPSMAVLEVNGVQHFSSDVRSQFGRMTVVTSKTTLPDKYNNEERTKELINNGIYNEFTHIVDTNVNVNTLISFTYTEFADPFPPTRQ